MIMSSWDKIKHLKIESLKELKDFIMKEYRNKRKKEKGMKK
jgi:hypothetical protein